MAMTMAMAIEQASGWIRGAVLGGGSFGTVSLAVEKSQGRLFAVKSVDLDARGDELAALENERSILSSIESPHVVSCLGGGVSAATGERAATRDLFLEYMPGGSVVDLMAKLGGGGMDESLVRAYTLSILRGLQRIHSEGIVHCDLKGKNVLVGGAAGVKLADFGSAKRVSGGGDCGAPAVLKGTPLWMAPEVVRNEAQEFASDIWSLGCTVVEMFTGKAPWSESQQQQEEHNTFAVLYRIGYSDEVPQVPQGRISKTGEDFLARCLCRDASGRATAEELLRHPFVASPEQQQQQQQQKQQELQIASPRGPLDLSRWSSFSSLISPASSPRSPNVNNWIVVHSPRSGACTFDGLSDFSEETAPVAAPSSEEQLSIQETEEAPSCSAPQEQEEQQVQEQASSSNSSSNSSSSQLEQDEASNSRIGEGCDSHISGGDEGGASDDPPPPRLIDPPCESAVALACCSNSRNENKTGSLQCHAFLQVAPHTHTHTHTLTLTHTKANWACGAVRWGVRCAGI